MEQLNTAELLYKRRQEGMKVGRKEKREEREENKAANKFQSGSHELI